MLSQSPLWLLFLLLQLIVHVLLVLAMTSFIPFAIDAVVMVTMSVDTTPPVLRDCARGALLLRIA